MVCVLWNADENRLLPLLYGEHDRHPPLSLEEQARDRGGGERCEERPVGGTERSDQPPSREREGDCAEELLGCGRRRCEHGSSEREAPDDEHEGADRPGVP